MKVGIFLFATEYSADPAVLAKKAEELGFDSFWVPEHPIIPVKHSARYPASAEGVAMDQFYEQLLARVFARRPDSYGRIVDPFVALARASAVTKTIKLGTAICLVPEHNPLLLAKEIATLDHFSGGRFLFGIGAGWLKEEIDIMGGDFAHCWSQTRDGILAMKELWTKEEAEYHGKYYDFPAVRSFPKPAQKPHPPVFLGGAAKNVFKRVVEWGDGWLPARVTVKDIAEGRAVLNELAEKVGRDPQSIEVLAFGMPDQFRNREEIKDLEKAGASHVTIWLTQTEGHDALAEMEEVARKVLS